MAKMGEIEIDLRAALAPVALTLECVEIMGLVTSEVQRARKLHGDQTDRPLGTGPLATYLNDLAQVTHEDTPITQLYMLNNAVVADLARETYEDAGDDATWAHIAGEEFFELLAEEDPDKIETEAIQTMAMLVNIVLTARKVKAAA